MSGSARTPSIHVRPAPGRTSSVVLVLPGGRATSSAPARRRQLSAVRMIPFAAALHRHDTAVWTVGYRYRGWNGHRADPVADARWALAEVHGRHGEVPVALVGHSMGGRAALRVADDPAVVAVVALAPWLPLDEPVRWVRDRRVLLVHGTADRRTDPAGSRRFAALATPFASEVRLVEVPGAGHPMLRRAALWHRLTRDFVEASLTATRGRREAP